MQREMLMARWFSDFDDFLTFSCFSDVGVLSWRKLCCMLSFFLRMFSTSVNVSQEHERRCASVELFFLSRSSATSLIPSRDMVQLQRSEMGLGAAGPCSLDFTRSTHAFPCCLLSGDWMAGSVLRCTCFECKFRWLLYMSFDGCPLRDEVCQKLIFGNVKKLKVYICKIFKL